MSSACTQVMSPEPAAEMQSADAQGEAASSSPSPTPQENTAQPAVRVRPAAHLVAGSSSRSVPAAFPLGVLLYIPQLSLWP